MELSDEQEKLLKQRQSGILPEIEFPGQIYVVDWKERMLRPIDSLDLKPLKLSENGMGFYGDSYHFVYDTKKKEWGELDDFDHLPNLAIIKVPGGLILDPVGVAREHGFNERLFVSRNPIRPKLIAEVRSVSKSNLQRFIDNERKQSKTLKVIRGIKRRGRGRKK